MFKTFITIFMVFYSCLAIGSSGESKHNIYRLKIYYITSTDIPLSPEAEPIELKKYAGTIIDTYSSAIDIYNTINKIKFSSDVTTKPVTFGNSTINTILEFIDKDGEVTILFGAYDKIYNQDLTKYINYSEYSTDDLIILRLIFPDVCYSVPLREGEEKIITMMNMPCYKSN